ncbi:unnamed protein product [Tetraodon nigroviridis]|uniref:(spotted green pufferfish) hypothetical protein n=1 Tax=Tetraodon nigroviridis TaxID=99883 RepID=Q4T334_TETNG|nr:unnamed protein product [Tetraodon nigroviridis]
MLCCGCSLKVRTAAVSAGALGCPPWLNLWLWWEASGCCSSSSSPVEGGVRSHFASVVWPPPASARKLHQQFKLYKDQVKKLGEESQAAHLSRPESATCGVCRKTKFADGCGHACCYCQSRFCARCGGRVSLRANKVMWVCNGCRKQQDILTQSGDLDSAHHRSPGVPLPPTHTLLGGPAPLSNGALERHGEPAHPSSSSSSPSSSSPPSPPSSPPSSPSSSSPSSSPPSSPSSPSSPPPSSPSPPSSPPSPSSPPPSSPSSPSSPPPSSPPSPSSTHPTFHQTKLLISLIVRDGRGRWLSQDLDQDLDLHQRECRRRQEEEFQARYRSDPNLARYPVKPQPCEEAMRMLAQVGRVRHQRRHSDVSLANAAPQHLTPPRTALRQGYPRGGPRSLSVERAASHSGAASPRHSPQHLEPSPAPRRKPAYESAAQRGRAVTAMHVIGSFSSSEDELEYASCDEHHSEWLARR